MTHRLDKDTHVLDIISNVNHRHQPSVFHRTLE
jgi:hypothetical protein